MSDLLDRRRLLVAGAGALVAATAGACVGPAPRRASSADEHPLTGMTDFDGNELPMPVLKGQVTVLDFWASWCAPCRVEFRYLDQLWSTFRRDGLSMLGVSIDDDPAAAENFRAFSRTRFPVAWDGSGLIRERFDVASLPTTLLLDREVKLVYRHTGFTPDDHRVLEDHVRRLLRA